MQMIMISNTSVNNEPLPMNACRVPTRGRAWFELSAECPRWQVSRGAA